MFFNRPDINDIFPEPDKSASWKSKKNYKYDYVNIPVKYIVRIFVLLLIAFAMLDIYLTVKIYMEYSSGV